MSTYRDNLEAENLKLKAQLQEAISEIEKLKPKPTPAPIIILDAMLVYRVVRAPDRRVFYIDISNVAPNDVAAYMEAAKAHSPPSRVTYGHDSFLNHFRSPSSELKLRVGLVSATIVLILAIFSS